MEVAGVFWDIENCAVPHHKSAFALVQVRFLKCTCNVSRVYLWFLVPSELSQIIYLKRDLQTKKFHLKLRRKGNFLRGFWRNTYFDWISNRTPSHVVLFHMILEQTHTSLVYYWYWGSMIPNNKMWLGVPFEIQSKEACLFGWTSNRTILLEDLLPPIYHYTGRHMSSIFTGQK